MHLFFDLDGTLTDSFPGISNCIAHALVALGRERVPETHYRGLVGLPLVTIFGTLCGSNDPAFLERAVALYRERFNSTGMFENSVYPGVPEALGAFRSAGHSLQVVTAKPAVSARRVLEHFDLAGAFDAIHGPDLADRSCNKADLVASAVAVAGSRNAVMIGDRAEDIAAGRAHGIGTVGAAWGYGARSELLEAQPDYLAETVADLVAWVQHSPP